MTQDNVMTRSKMKEMQAVPSNPVTKFHSCTCVDKQKTSPLLKTRDGYKCSVCGKDA